MASFAEFMNAASYVTIQSNDYLILKLSMLDVVTSIILLNITRFWGKSELGQHNTLLQHHPGICWDCFVPFLLLTLTSSREDVY